jgi:hypothetical protein
MNHAPFVMRLVVVFIKPFSPRSVNILPHLATFRIRLQGQNRTHRAREGFGGVLPQGTRPDADGGGATTLGGAVRPVE